MSRYGGEVFVMFKLQGLMSMLFVWRTIMLRFIKFMYNFILSD